ncbi:MAG: hypothetical protein ACRCTZ_21815 [Sarcina sp.]
MDLKQILLDAGIGEEQINSIASNINKQISKEFVPKDKYNSKAGNISELEDKISELENNLLEKDSKLSKLEDIKTNYDALTTEYNNYKTDIETKEINSTKSNKIKNMFKEEGYNERIIKHMIKDIDLSKLELNDDGINYPEEELNSIRSEYEPFKQVITTTGAEPSTPPTNNNEPTDPFLQGFGD